ncbi:MAG TPA: hypothetical protein VHX86_02790 [Tepidisphaeraceae bacterium]|nr:hypothetical protein [Tepidisphaeraceae bacterium]
MDAAEALQNAANATRGFKGWVHVMPVGQGDPLSAIKLRVQSIDINTSSGDFAIVANVYGALIVQMYSPAAHEMRTYTSLSGTVLISSVPGDAAETRRAAEFPFKLADFLKRITSRGLTAPTVAESNDQGLQKFNLTLSDDSKKTLDQYPELPNGNATLWVDPQSKLIRKMTSQIEGQPVIMEYTYGEPNIRDIYDLGVPKTARIVDNRQVETDANRPAMSNLPPTAQLVKDESIDVKAFEARLQKRIDRDWGDFVLLECHKTGRGHSEGQLTIDARQGDKALYAIYLLSPELALWGGEGFPKGWPTPMLSDVVSQLRSVRPLGSDAFDGKTAWHGDMISGFNIQPTTGNSASLEVKSAMVFWPLLAPLPDHFGSRKVEILRDPARPGLIVVHIDETSTFQVPDSKAAYHSDALYWLDPAHDDLPVETVEHSNARGGDKLNFLRHVVYLDFARVAEGRWYPSHWQDGVEHWQQIIQNENLGPEWYGDPNLRITDAGIRFPTTEPTPARR